MVSFGDSISLHGLTKDKHISKHNPEKMGNTADIAFGGCNVSIAVRAAILAVPSTFFCYSAQGYFLGPTLASDKVILITHRVRDTKSFKTVRVEIKQLQKNIERTTFVMMVDFQLKEVAVLKYSVPLRIQPPTPETLLSWPDELARRVKAGELDRKLMKAWTSVFGLMLRHFEIRYNPQSINGQNLSGMDKQAELTQAHLSMTQKSSSYWFRSLTRLSHEESYAAIGFVTDAGLAFLPVSFQNQFITDYGPISTLDCSLRFHTSEFSCNDWLLHEQTTEAANEGRTFSVGRIFKQDGTLVASMHQMSIIRPKPERISIAKI